ncbi:glycosyltransferase family 39 protein [Bdellovibrio reynosensis]|uniref:Glycosyltransferase family 39 protein n=1 Tax=Bdellovibrio reynosensis TaxID=2835041 RepID=A0ABY4CCP1_9BACT|nr:glycosyltransferase family 39 protein [Bdellovibrio reynosensis]UOF02736.1 glycosyltransferase family 39 protein [Bdellovibrio reynosensis]
MKDFKVTKYHRAFLWLALLFLVMWTRFFHLSAKPIHFDESINGWFSLQIFKGLYKYDPNNYHGPLYFYLLAGFENLWGRSLEVLRAAPAVFSVLSVVLFSFRPLRNQTSQNWLIFFLILSPAFIFFGRSGIHEMPFVFFQILLMVGVIRWLEIKDTKALVLVLFGIWGITLLKETFVITLFSIFIALCTLGFAWWKDLAKQIAKIWNTQLTWLTLILLFLFAQFYTSFFTNARGLIDFINSFLPWAKTGIHGHGHDKEFWFWLGVLLKAEPVALLGVIISCFTIFSRSAPLRAVSIFSLVQLVVYSVIPYKTIWCLLSLVWGFYFVLAFTFVEIKRVKLRNLLIAITLFLSLFNILSAFNSSYRKPLQFSHPFFYVNSTYAAQDLQNLILETAKQHPLLLEEPVQIGMAEQWPWPWTLRHFTKISYDLCGKNLIATAAIYMCEQSDMSKVEEFVGDDYWKIELPIRQARGNSIIYLKKTFFKEEPRISNE